MSLKEIHARPWKESGLGCGIIFSRIKEFIHSNLSVLSIKFKIKIISWRAIIVSGPLLQKRSVLVGLFISTRHHNHHHRMFSEILRGIIIVMFHRLTLSGCILNVPSLLLCHCDLVSPSSTKNGKLVCHPQVMLASFNVGYCF